MYTSSAVAIFIRVVIALATQTLFQPDEYFQSLEVAHHAVFGYGHLTWEWLSPEPIRSIFYPSLNVPIYWGLKALGLDHTKLLIWGPKVLHGLFASMTDIWLCELTRKVVGERYVNTALLLSLSSFFHGLSLSRSLSNSLETSLTTVALTYFSWDPVVPFHSQDFRKAMIFAALACAVRPTNSIIWVYVCARLLWRLRLRPNDVWFFLINGFAIGFASLCALLAVDSVYYGQATFTPLNFLRTNMSSVSLFYGNSPWHYYLSQAIPILCTTTVVFVFHGAWLALGPSATPLLKNILGLVVWTIGVYSLAGHKEWRFIHPMLPLMHILASKSLVDLYHRTVPAKCRSAIFPIRGRHLCLLTLPVPAIVYVSLFHGRAQIDVMYFLRNIPSEGVRSVGFLMPCHSTPWQAYLHRPDLAGTGKLWALGCEPPLQGQNVSNYKDQTDIFYDSPARYLRTYFPNEVDPKFPPSPFPCSTPGSDSNAGAIWRHEWPEYLVLEKFGPRKLDGRAIKDVTAA